MAPANLIDADASPKLDGGSKPVKSSKLPLPEVKEFDSSSATVDDVVNALKIAGGVIVRNFLDMEDIDRILKDVNPYLDSDKPWDGNQSNSATLFINFSRPLDRKHLPSRDPTGLWLDGQVSHFRHIDCRKPSLDGCHRCLPHQPHQT